MKRILEILKKSKSVKLSACQNFSIAQDEADLVYGGVKEYVPPIYECNNEREKRSVKITDLLTDINSK